MVLAVSLVASASACGGSDESDDTSSAGVDQVTYATAFGAVGRDAFAWVAQEKGFFEEENLEVTIELGAGVGENLKVLAAGQVDFAALDMAGSWISYAAGEYTDYQAIMSIHQQNLVSIITLEGSGITSPQDLEGKNIGAASGSVNQKLFPAYANAAGIDQSKVTFVDAKTTQLASMLATGQVEALSIFLLSQAAIESVAGKSAVVLPYSTYLSDLYGNGIVASTETINSDPDLVKRFRRAMIKAIKYTIANPQEAAEIMNKAQPTANVDSAVAEITTMTPYVGSDDEIGLIDETRVAKSIATLQANGVIAEALSPDALVNLEIATEAV